MSKSARRDGTPGARKKHAAFSKLSRAELYGKAPKKSKSLGEKRYGQRSEGGQKSVRAEHPKGENRRTRSGARNTAGWRGQQPGQERHGKAADIVLSNARPAKKQHVSKHGREGTLEDTHEGVRLQKVLAKAGVASRRMSEKLIEQGRVEVDGTIVTSQGLRIDPENSVVRVDGVRVKINEELEYLVLNKPRGVQCTMHDELGRPCVGDIVSEQRAAGQGLFHVGRLDAATEGLIILTNDGELANRLMHPKYKVRKTYLAHVYGEADRALIRTLREGLELDDGKASMDYVQIVDTFQGKSLLKMEIHEGRKHIVRRLLKAAGYPVERLVRTKIHTIQLGELPPGAFRALNDAEIRSLYKVVEL